jgi:hypothetical protein
MSDGAGDLKGSVDLAEEAYTRAASTPEPEHTDIHVRLSRPLEFLQDAVVPATV